jgi:hypothetical protein
VSAGRERARADQEIAMAAGSTTRAMRAGTAKAMGIVMAKVATYSDHD